MIDAIISEGQRTEIVGETNSFRDLEDPTPDHRQTTKKTVPMNLPLPKKHALMATSTRLGLGMLALAITSTAVAQSHKSNTLTGEKAGNKITTGKQNTADGFKALLKNKTGGFNTAVGSGALKKTTGNSNVAMGFQALFKNTSGQFNVAIGDGAMKFNKTGNNNVALGMDAGANTDGSDNILIDHVGVAGESGVIRIGTNGTHDKAFIAGQINGDGSGLTGVTATNVSGQISGGQIAPASVTSAQLAPNLRLTGNVGIGTSNASVPLEVTGSAVSSADGAGIASFGPTTGQHLAFDNNEIMSFNGNSPSTLYLAYWGGTVSIAASSSDNVGIGTSSPSSKLEVRGDIELGSGGQYQAVAGAEKLRILRGEINTVGTIIEGTGFTSTRASAGVYNISYSENFSDTPAVTATALDVNVPEIITYSSSNNTSVTIRVFSLAGTPTDSVFSFIAVGPR